MMQLPPKNVPCEDTALCDDDTYIILNSMEQLKMTQALVDSIIAKQK